MTTGLNTHDIVHTDGTRAVLERVPTVGRLAYGAIFLVFGLNGFLNFLPAPTLPERALAFGGALGATGYMFPLIKGTEIAVAILLLSNRFVPLALALIAPNIVNIVAFHVMLAPSGLPLAILVLALELYMAWVYRGAFRPMLVARAKPNGSPRS
jgi:hypothetical protein